MCASIYSEEDEEMKKPYRNSGFSLVELIVVIAIMAVLVGVLAPQFIKFVEKSRMSADIQNIETLCHTVETFAADVDRHRITIPHECQIDLFPGGEYTVSSAAVSGDNKYWQLALENAGIEKYGLRSKNWFDSSNHITITAHELNGMPYFTESGVRSGLSIVGGDYMEE